MSAPENNAAPRPRLATSVAVMGTIMLVMNGGRGITGRAGGGAVGCGGAVETTETGSAPLERLELPEQAAPAASVALTLDPSESTLRLLPTAPVRPRRPLNVGAPNPVREEVEEPVNETTPIRIPTPRGGPNVLLGARSAGATLFAEAAQGTALQTILDHPYRQFTLFAPSNSAFEMFRGANPELFDPKNQTLLVDYLAQYVVVDRQFVGQSPSWTDATVSSLVPGVELIFEVTSPVAGVVQGGDVRAGTQPGSEYLANNGVVHVIDQALPVRFTAWSYIRNAGYSYFASAVEAAQKVETFAQLDVSWTILIPTDDALRQAGWTLNRIHDPGERQAVKALIDAHVFKAPYPIQKLVSGATTEGGIPVVAKVGQSLPTQIVRLDQTWAVTVVEADGPSAAGGYLHAIDQLLIP